jgi:DNA (cytosine-5)-methyltransferase 1
LYRYVSCQTFAGGFDVGMVQAGFELVHKVEQKGGFGMPNCLANRDVLGHSWTHQSGDYREWHAPSVDVIAANPPCSGFSLMTDSKHRGVDAKVNACMWVLMEYAARIKPQIIVMESVRQAYSNGRELMTQLRANLEEKSGLKYDLYHVMHNALKVGGAAERKRYFWVASQLPFGVDFPQVRKPWIPDVIGDLENLALTWERQPYRLPPTWWSRGPRADFGAVDGMAVRDGIPIRRLLDLLQFVQECDAEGWPPGWDIGKMAKHTFEKHGCLPESWDSMKSKLIANNFHMGFTSAIRWHVQKRARVITGSALDHVIHPTLPRLITHREAARIMGFPDNWRIAPLKHNSNLKLTWGKGITTQCGKWIGEQAKRALDGEPGSIIGTPVGEREWLIKD